MTCHKCSDDLSQVSDAAMQQMTCSDAAMTCHRAPKGNPSPLIGFFVESSHAAKSAFGLSRRFTLRCLQCAIVVHSVFESVAASRMPLHLMNYYGDVLAQSMHTFVFICCITLRCIVS